MFEKNTRQVNQMMAKMFALGSIIILFLAMCSCLGIFEFGKEYTIIVFVVGLIVSITPSILIRFLSDNIMKHYMLIISAIFIGVLGTNNHIGVYITYALVPIISCLYFDTVLILKTSIFAYFVMAISVYINSAQKFEVIYLGRPRLEMFVAYLLGFTVEYLVVNTILYFIVKRAKLMMEERYTAEEENRMKSEFLSSMSHEIRTPMNAIIGMSNVALRKEMSEDLRRCIKIIKSSSTGLLEIVNDILDLSKIEVGKMNIIVDTYSTKSLIDDMKAIIDARNIDKKVPIYFHIQESIPAFLEGDVVRIKQVMLNLASNAIKYTQQGRIDIIVECKDMNNGYAKMIYTVKDTGQGIKKDEINKLFIMYNQLNVEKNYGQEGTGIGLAISKHFIECMGGVIDVESEYGKGSVFSFTISQKIINKQLEENKSIEDSYFETKDACILLVDDNEINREVIKEILEPLKLTIEEAENGLEAVQMAKNTTYDMIFMDSHMPIMNGEEATRHIRETNNKVPIIALTADAISGVKEKLLSAGMDDYVEKPVDIEIICAIVKKYLPADKILIR